MARNGEAGHAGIFGEGKKILDTKGLFAVKEFLEENLMEILTRLNRLEGIDELFNVIGVDTPITKKPAPKRFLDGKFVVIGASRAKQKELVKTAKKLGLPKERFEFHLDYDEAASINMSKHLFNPYCSAILCGPMPHSGVGKGDDSSIITHMENAEGFPNATRVVSSKGELKITKSSFRRTLKQLLEGHMIVATA